MSTGPAQASVLVVDDSRFVRTTFASILRSSFTVREAADGEEAWAAIDADPSIVLVLTDLDMPESFGMSRSVSTRTIEGAASFASILRSSFTVREAADGEEAWAAIDADPSIVLVLTDLDMPKLSGFALIGRVRNSTNDRIRELPVVVISGNEEAGAKERARDAGA